MNISPDPQRPFFCFLEILVKWKYYSSSLRSNLTGFHCSHMCCTGIFFLLKIVKLIHDIVFTNICLNIIYSSWVQNTMTKAAGDGGI